MLEASTDTKTVMKPPEISLQGFTSHPDGVKNKTFFLSKIPLKVGKGGWMGGAGRAGDLGPLGWDPGHIRPLMHPSDIRVLG